MTCGEACFTYIAEELPALAAGMFRLSTEPEDLMICGLSMGGCARLLFFSFRFLMPVL